MTDEMLSVLAVVAYAVIGIMLVKRARRCGEEEPEDEPEDFEFLTVREQLKAAQRVSDGIGSMEQLQTDIAESTEDDVLAVHIEWIGRDGAAHQHDLLCSGIDTASECLAEIAARESHMLRETLSRQLATMKSGNRIEGSEHEKIQDGVRKKPERASGEW